MSEPVKTQSKRGLDSFLSCITYALSSSSLALLNKILLDKFQVVNLWSLFAFTSVFVMILTLGLYLPQGKSRPINLKTYSKFIYIGFMNAIVAYTSTKALQKLTVPTFSVLKNLSILITAFGEYLAFGRKGNLLEKISFFLVILGTVLSSYTDLNYDFEGYAFMIVGLLMLTLQAVGVKYIKSKSDIGDQELIIYGQLTAAPLYLVLAHFNGELVDGVSLANFKEGFITILLLTGVVSFVQVNSTFWCISKVGPTSYSILSALNKIISTVVGFFLFSIKTSPKYIISVIIAIFAGMLYSYSQYLRQLDEAPKQEEISKKAD